MEWNASTASRESPFQTQPEAPSQYSPFSTEQPAGETRWDVMTGRVQEVSPYQTSGEEPEMEGAEGAFRESESSPAPGGWLRSLSSGGVDTYSGTGQLYFDPQMEFDTPQGGTGTTTPIRTLKVVNVWQRPPYPAGYKNVLIARAVVRVHTKDLFGWFMHLDFPNVWFRRLDADLTDLVPDVDVTLEVFRQITPQKPDDMGDSVKRYLEIRHMTDLKATPFWVGHIYSMRAVDLPAKLGVNLDPLLSAAKVKGIAIGEQDKYFLAAYASFPAEIERSMVPEEKVTLSGFVTAEYAINGDHMTPIKNIALKIKASQTTTGGLRTVRLMGHTDNQAIEGGNVALGWRRALTVREQLISELEALEPGLSKKISFFVESLGDQQPVASNSTDPGRELNRRVEVYLSQVGKGPIITGHIKLVPIEDVSRRGLELLKKAGLAPVETDVLACLLRKVLPADAEDQYVDGTLVRLVWDTGNPRPEFYRLKGAFTIRDAFGPDVPDADFIRRLRERSAAIVEGIDVVNQISGVQGGATSHGVEGLKNWMAKQVQNDNSVYSCYKNI